MAVQKRRKSRAQSRTTRSQWMARTKTPNVSRCPNCDEPRRSHRVCLKCGYYDGQKVRDVKEAAE